MRSLMAVGLVLGIIFILSAAPARADEVETLSFTGRASCFIAPSCGSNPSTGTVTGTYMLDVTTQRIVGAWSFSTPWADFGSGTTGAGANAFFQGAPFNEYIGQFAVQTTSPNYFVILNLFFPGSQEIGPVDASNSVGCYDTSASTPGPSCVYGYAVIGSNTLEGVQVTPEPSSLLLFGGVCSV